jgi:hypothetical protein
MDEDRKRIFIGLGGVRLVLMLEITIIAAGVLVALKFGFGMHIPLVG